MGCAIRRLGALELPDYAVALSVVACTIEGIDAFVIRTDKNNSGSGDHSPNLVQIAAPVRLREALSLSDGDEVNLILPT
jgi:CTP-dependent riboflavin kinase